MLVATSPVAKSITPVLVDQVEEVARRGGIPEEMALRKVEWFYAYLETGDATGSVKKCGFDVQQPSWKANQLVKQFYPLIIEAVMIRRAAIEPLALKVHEDIMRLDHMVPVKLKDGEGNEFLSDRMVPDAKILAVKQKAADSILDRGIMPKGLALHGNLPGSGEGEKSSDWKQHLDELVARLGVDVVKGLSMVKSRADMREYLERQYPVKMVNEVPQAAMEANGSTQDNPPGQS